MTERYFISDTHFGHANILHFPGLYGIGVRPGFTAVEEMNEIMIERWNAVVGENDKIYHLGDCCMGGIKTVETILPRLKGKKRLILGNHDNVIGHQLWRFFDKIVVSQKFEEMGRKFLATHIPVHDTSIDKAGVEFCVHGHLHEKPDVSPYHLNISVEQTDYAPIHILEIMRRMEFKRQPSYIRHTEVVARKKE